MDKEQQEVLQKFGFYTEELPGAFRNPRATFYGVDKQTGGIKVMPDLPADPFSLGIWLRKGYVLDPKNLKQSVEKSQEGSEFTCQDCSKVFPSRIALLGHSRTHKNKKSLLEVK